MYFVIVGSTTFQRITGSLDWNFRQVYFPHNRFLHNEIGIVQFLSWFVRRWRMEVTFEKARAHLGIETQRQWNDLAIARTTPVLFGLFSMVTLMADQLIKTEVKPVRTAAWYEKQTPTFADAIVIVMWSSCHFSTSGKNRDVVKVTRSLLERLTDAVCYAA
jgi:hypothetical protein